MPLDETPAWNPFAPWWWEQQRPTHTREALAFSEGYLWTLRRAEQAWFWAEVAQCALCYAMAEYPDLQPHWTVRQYLESFVSLR